MAQAPQLIVIAGPTAAGKTKAAIELALHFNTEIISFDSRQCYHELNIGVARPSSTELSLVPHHFIASHSIHHPIDAASFALHGQRILQEIFKRQPIAVAVGGTGLYLKALTEGLDDMPEIPSDIRNAVRVSFQNNGLPWVQSEMKRRDPEFSTDPETLNNPHRMLRALEVVLATGNSIRQYQNRKAFAPLYDITLLGLELPRPLLYERINLRVEKMMQAGLLEEVRQLLPFRDLQALQTVGYTELFDYLQGNCSFETAVENIRMHTRRYAKRQMTWFSKLPGIKWFSPEDFSGMAAYAESVARSTN